MVDNDDTLSVAQRNLRQLMQARGVTPADVARACNCTRELVYRWLSGDRNITAPKIKCLASFFGVSESYMQYGTPPLDADKVADVAAGAIEALVEAGLVHTGVSAEQVGNFIGQVCADYEIKGNVDQDQLRRYVRMLAPLSRRTQ